MFRLRQVVAWKILACYATVTFCDYLPVWVRISPGNLVLNPFLPPPRKLPHLVALRVAPWVRRGGETTLDRPSSRFSLLSEAV